MSPVVNEHSSEVRAKDGFEQTLSRFIVGIDLGTTNCAVAYLDTEQPSRIENFSVEQWVDFGTREKRELLPSFLYYPLAEESQSLASGGRIEKSWFVGSLARDRGLQQPGRQIASAKSWLCHDGVDRRSPILPWQNDDDVDKISPIQASTQILFHIRRVWDLAHQTHPLAEQDIVLTLPASFDQVARQLTIEAAAAAGLTRILPIEEPQAAFYAWLACHADNWEEKVAPGQSILVCDIGGGTTDFTLIRVREANVTNSATGLSETLDDKNRGKLSLHRVAVGQHLILGGDNIDLALARMAEQKLSEGSSLTTRSWDALRQACRLAKETLLGNNPPDTTSIHLPGSGSRLVGGGRQVEVTQQEVRSTVLDGFFPDCPLSARPHSQQIGFQEFGLPFAQAPATTKHLAAFLWDHRYDGRSDNELHMDDLTAARPDWILFNGGVMTSAQLRSRIVSVVSSWFAGQAGIAEHWAPGVLDGERLDLAVARGATYFGQVRRGTGVEIEANLACSYYIQTCYDPPQALCIVPGSASPGQTFALSEQPMELAVGQPVQFPIVYSTTRLADRVGETVAIDTEHFAALPPIRTVIESLGSRRQKSVPVVVEVELSQIGTLQVYCHCRESEQRWKLEFDVRGSTQTDHVNVEAAGNQAGLLDDQAARQAHHVLAELFSDAGKAKPAQLMSTLAHTLTLRKADWPPNLLRSMWSSLLELQDGRRKSPEHEARWLNLLGYALRPGYGLAADDWRVAQTWRAVHGKLCFGTANSRNESLVLWRRIAGGFTAGQQLTVYQQIAASVKSLLDPTRRGKGLPTPSPHELVELLRLIGSLELLPKSEKSQLGDWLVELLNVKKWNACHGAALWAIGRLGSRLPTYGPLNCVVDVDRVSGWLRQLIKLDTSTGKLPQADLVLALMLTGRRVNDRYRDISHELRQQVIEKLETCQAPEHAISLVREGGRLDSEEANQVLGESLPLGLTFRS